MIVKLKCVDNGGRYYFTTGGIYQVIEVHGCDRYSVVSNNGYKSIVSTDDKNNIEGKWKVVE